MVQFKLRFLLLSLMAGTMVAANAQDTIYKMDGKRLIAKIEKEDSTRVYFNFTKSGSTIHTFFYKTNIKDIRYFKSGMRASSGPTAKTEAEHDTILRKNGQKLMVDILKEDSTKVYFQLNGGKKASLPKSEIQSMHRATQIKTGYTLIDKITLGAGVGMDYGGIGGNLAYFPHKNIGLFAGVGYDLLGVGYNIGGKVRLVSEEKTTYVMPFVLAMYGYNAVIKVSNADYLNKTFYGINFGAGIDIRPSPKKKKGYFSLALLLPIRSSEVDSYIDSLEKNYGVVFSRKLWPVGFSIGYKLILY